MKWVAWAAVLLAACGEDAAPPSGVDAGMDAPMDAGRDVADVGGRDAGPAFGLRVPAAADIGQAVLIEVVGAVGPYAWQVGDEAFVGEEGRIERTFEEAGRYAIRVATGDGRMESALLLVTEPIRFASSHSSTIAVGPEHLAVVVPDASTLVIARHDLTEPHRQSVCDDPVGVTRWPSDEERWLVMCDGDHRIVLVVGDTQTELLLPRGSRPRGAAIDGEHAFVTLQGLGAIAEVRAGEGVLALVAVHEAIADIRAIAALPGGGVVASRFRSPDEGGELFWMRDTPSVTPLRFDPQPSADTESGGVPTLLGGLVVSPQGSRVVVVGQQANIAEGTFVSDRPLTFETSIRAALRVVSAEGDDDGEEVWDERFLFDNRGLVTAAVFSPRGDTLFVLDQAHRSVERLDRLNGEILGALLDVGFGASGIALSPDGDTLFVNAATSRELRAYDADATGPVSPRNSLRLVATEPLDDAVLRGRMLFEDSFDPRLARDGYIACASCHPGGDSDHRVWDFTDRGEGLRRTPPLFGRVADGPLHWSANFDEVQDFENDIRRHFGGRGLMTAGDFGETEETLGPPKAGRSADLDALAAYVASLTEDLPSPDEDSAAALRGAAIFERENCRTCHAGPRYTDSALIGGTPVLHDVGTMSPASGQRLGEALLGIDTPTLIGLWHSPRYLHDGSADTLLDVLTTRDPEGMHGNVAGLPSAELADLVAFLRSL